MALTLAYSLWAPRFALAHRDRNANINGRRNRLPARQGWKKFPTLERLQQGVIERGFRRGLGQLNLSASVGGDAKPRDGNEIEAAPT